MKPQLFILALLLVLSIHHQARNCAAESALNYGGRFSVPAVMRPDLAAAVGDLTSTLERMTGTEFSTVSDVSASSRLAAGIIVRKSDATEGTEQLAIYTNYTAAGPPRFFNPDGNQVEPDLVDKGHLMLVPIAESHRGAVWSLDRAKCPIGELKMLNTPAAFAVNPAALLIPEDALD
jgi:hypothetical protein